MRRVPIALAFVLAACHLLVGIEDRRERSASEIPDGGDSGPGANDPCSLIGTPPRPNVVDDKSDAGDFVFALAKIDLGLDGGLPFTLNLDRTCTCPGPDSCTRSGKDVKTACDGDGGHDNATAGALGLLAIVNVFSEESLNQNLKNGIAGALMRVQRYSGLPDDPSVTASFYGAIAFDGQRPTGRPEDRWIVDETALENPKEEYAPRYSDPNAYVANGVLVAAFDFPLEVGGNADQAPLRLDFRSGIIMARIDLTSGILRGVLGGRWPTDSIFKTIETVPDLGQPGSRICPGSSSYEIVRGLICSSRDISKDPLFDNKGVPCDALSSVIGFEARLAKFGGFDRRSAPPSSCEGGAGPHCAE